MWSKICTRKKLTKITIVITGASGDIAQAMVKKLAGQEKYDLILLSRNLTKLSKIYSDLTALSNIKLLQNEAEIPGKVDILINNAGFGTFANLTDLSKSQIEEEFQINTIWPILMIQKLNPQLQVINIASIAGKVPSSKSSIYAASKAGLIAFSDALRMERPDLIVTTVNTGPVKTKFHADNPGYLGKVGKNAVSAEFVADRIVKNLGKAKRELNLPWQMALIAKLRAIFPGLIDFMAVRFFNFK